MVKDSKSEIDPRFDPAFQRGFDPSIPIEKYVPPRQPRRAASPSVELATAAPPTAPAPVAVPAAPVAVSPPAPDPKPAVQADAAGVDADTDPAADGVVAPVEETQEANSVRNPFLLFLGIIAVALIAIGVWLFVRSGEAFNTSDVLSQGNFMSLTATIDMAPFIALLGVATAIGVLFVFAARWKRRR